MSCADCAYGISLIEQLKHPMSWVGILGTLAYVILFIAAVLGAEPMRSWVSSFWH